MADRSENETVLNRAAFVLSAVLFVSSACAEDHPAYGPIPDWVEKTADVSAPHDDAAVKLLLTEHQFRFSQSGAEGYFRSQARIQTPQGLASLGTITVPWNPATDALTIHKLQIVRANQTIDLLANGQTFTVLRRENNLEYAALDGVLTAVIQPAGLQVGDILELAFSLKRSDPVLTGASEWFVGGWSKLPISHLRIRGIWTRKDAVHWKASASMTGVRESRHGDGIEIRAALDDVTPPVVPKGSPARYGLGRWIEFSSFESWGQIAERLAPLYVHASNLSPQSPLNAEIARIRSSAPDKASQAVAALALVQDQVRYVFLGMNDGAMVPTDAELTWSRRFGDCKGKTALLLALLHGLDIEAEPVAVNITAGDGVKSNLPMVEAFNHVLVRSVIDGKTYWLDGARSGDRQLDDLTAPAYYWGLPLIPHGSDLVQIVAEPAKQPTDETIINIDASKGTAAAPVHAESAFRGPTAALMRLRLGNLSSDARDEALNKFWSQMLQSATIDKVAARYDEQRGREYFVMDGSMSMEWNSTGRKLEELALTYSLDTTREPGPERQVPVVVAFPAYSRVVEKITLPATQTPFTLEGEDISRTLAGMEFHREAHIEGGVLTAVASVRSLVPEIPFDVAEGAQKAIREITASAVYLHAPAEYLRSLPAPSGSLTETIAKREKTRHETALAPQSVAVTRTGKDHYVTAEGAVIRTVGCEEPAKTSTATLRYDGDASASSADNTLRFGSGATCSVDYVVR